MRIALVTETPDGVADALRRQLYIMCADASVVTYASGAAFLKDAASADDFAFAYLDTELPDMRGLEAALELRRMRSACKTVFLSGTADDALACYAAHPAGYVLRSSPERLICEPLEEYVGALAPCMRCLEVVSQRMTRRLALWDVDYIEVRGRTCLINTSSGIVSTNAPLSALLPNLPEDVFARCHRSYVVNLRRASRITKDAVLLSDGVQVPLSSGRRRYISECMARFAAGLLDI